MKILLALLFLSVSTCLHAEQIVIPYSSDTLIPPGSPIHAIVGKPSGNGPFPAVILMHGCGGINQYSLNVLTGYADHFNHLGYVTVIVDSFSQRTHVDVCEHS